MSLNLPVQGSIGDDFSQYRSDLHQLASSLLTMTRGHWTIENKSHYVRDTTWSEDSCRCHSGNLPQVLACFRNVAMNLIRLAGHTCIAAATRMFAACPERGIELINIPRTE